MELFIEQSMRELRLTEPNIHKEMANVENLIFKIESPWGLERAKALTQGRATELFTSPPPRE